MVNLPKTTSVSAKARSHLRPRRTGSIQLRKIVVLLSLLSTNRNIYIAICNLRKAPPMSRTTIIRLHTVKPKQCTIALHFAHSHANVAHGHTHLAHSHTFFMHCHSNLVNSQYRFRALLYIFYFWAYTFTN